MRGELNILAQHETEELPLLLLLPLLLPMPMPLLLFPIKVDQKADLCASGEQANQSNGTPLPSFSLFSAALNWA